jgi:hypothetical protein
MTEGTISLILAALALVIAIIAFLNTRKEAATAPVTDYNTVPLQLQAYERLVLLVERISLPNLVGRMNHPHLTARELQLLLLENIKQEFEYNVTQQVYVPQHAWNAVQNLKDQNMLIINQVANVMPAQSTGHELSRQLMEVIMSQEEKALHTIVLDALNYEAKRLLK